MQRWPRPHEQDVLALWSGLGYYRRARMLHKAAQTVVAEHAGNLPATAAELRELPGIGAYTAAAIASIAHGEPVAVVDGNVERVLSRIRGWESHDAVGEAAVRRKVEEFAAALVDPRRPGDFNQAIMELGATVCTPRNPQCLVCPLATECRTLGEHKTPKRAPMTSREIACALFVSESDAATEVLLEQRAATNTVMPGLWELPPLRSHVLPLSKKSIDRAPRHHAGQLHRARLHIAAAATSPRLRPLPRIAALGSARRSVCHGAHRPRPQSAHPRRPAANPARSSQAAFASPAIRELV